MNNSTDDLNILGYVSSAADVNLAPEVEVKPEDLADLTTLENVQRLLKDRKKYFISVESLSLEDKTFTVEQQLAINKRVLFHLQELEGLVEGTVNRVKEKLNER